MEQIKSFNDDVMDLEDLLVGNKFFTVPVNLQILYYNYYYHNAYKL